MEESFIELQAILAGLPIHAVPSPEFTRSCGPDVLVQCGGQRGRCGRSAERHCTARIEDRLQAIWEDYPEHQEVLGRLRVEHANLDMVCLADHVERRLFTAARGTDRNVNPLTTPRDWTNNMRILLGLDPGRTAEMVENYRAIRERYPGYASFGSGHSLGGAVILCLAKEVEVTPSLMFSRIDVFNTAVSPLTRSLVILTKTAFHAHRVYGDWASWGMCLSPPPATVAVHTHPVKPHVRERHALGHFLPDKAGSSTPSTQSGELSPSEDSSSANSPADDRRPSSALWFLGVLSCVGVRQKRPRELRDGATALANAREGKTGAAERGAPAMAPVSPFSEDGEGAVKPLQRPAASEGAQVQKGDDEAVKPLQRPEDSEASGHPLASALAALPPPEAAATPNAGEHVEEAALSRARAATATAAAGVGGTAPSAPAVAVDEAVASEAGAIAAAEAAKSDGGGIAAAEVAAAGEAAKSEAGAIAAAEAATPEASPAAAAEAEEPEPEALAAAGLAEPEAARAAGAEGSAPEAAVATRATEPEAVPVASPELAEAALEESGLPLAVAGGAHLPSAAAADHEQPVAMAVS